MNYLVAYHTDVGTKKETNQDSLAIKMIDTPRGRAVFAMVCDGMGGLSNGELASKEVVESYSNWFDTSFTKAAGEEAVSWEQLQQQWQAVANEQNIRLGRYGQRVAAAMGTTLSLLLLYQDCYYFAQVGDSRIYQLTNQIEQLTHDQTLIEREIAAGRLTREEAKLDPRQNVLLQCIGASPVVDLEFGTGKISAHTSFIICSDGFRHAISTKELFDNLGPDRTTTPENMKRSCIELTELIKARGEKDNITVIAIGTY